tara:strand:+ start:398 stop:862 length:465 start_codon:yes stop_codon:yes gene_type:complete
LKKRTTTTISKPVVSRYRTKSQTFQKVTAEFNGVSCDFRSGLEYKVALYLDKQGVKFEFEPHKIKYEVPAKSRNYLPDFVLPNGIYLEVKGRFDSKDRQKMKLVKASNPDLDIRFLFANAKTRLNRSSKTTYAMWSDKNGFPWCEKKVPFSWIL